MPVRAASVDPHPEALEATPLHGGQLRELALDPGRERRRGLRMM
jgi:hypothetical protein